MSMSDSTWFNSKPRNWSHYYEAMSHKRLGVIISDEKFLPAKSRENDCVIKALSTEVLSGAKWWSAWLENPASLPTSHIAALRSQRTPTARTACCSEKNVPIFHKKSQSPSSHSAKLPNVPFVPIAPVREAQLLKPPLLRNRPYQPCGTRGPSMWGVTGGKGRRLGIYTVIMFSSLAAKRIFIL